MIPKSNSQKFIPAFEIIEIFEVEVMFSYIKLSLCFVLILVFGCDKPNFSHPSLQGKIKEDITQRCKDATSIIVYSKIIHPESDAYIPPCTTEELMELPHAEFNLELFKSLIQFTEFEKNVIWKGGNLAVIQLPNHSELRIAMSFYDSFFRVLGEQGYYTFRSNEYAAEKWYAEYHERILQGIFMRNAMEMGEEPSLPVFQPILPPDE